MIFTLKVAQVRRETDDTVTLCFKQPALRKIKYEAGQYLTLILRINGRRYIRPYSFSSCPGVDEFLEITVKRVPNGIVSNHINDLLKEGDTIEALSPMGDFTYTFNPAITKIYLWGVGSGITPLISIAKNILSTTDHVKVLLSYGNRAHDTTIFLNQITAIQKQYHQRFTVKHFHTRLATDKNNPNVIQGRIDENKALSILNTNDAQVHSSSHYICGPFGLKESVKKALSVKYINPNYIFSEDFVIIKDPKDFEHIYTQNVELIFKGSNYSLEVVKGKSILEAALDADIELPYSCQTGNCGSCKAKLKEGQLKMIGLTKEREDLAQDDFLLCCSYPLVNPISIEVI